jgi:hypothetical protein
VSFLIALFLAKAIEHMLIDGLLEAEPYMHIASQIEDPERYLYLTDDIKTRIQATNSPVSRLHIPQLNKMLTLTLF